MHDKSKSIVVTVSECTTTDESQKCNTIKENCMNIGGGELGARPSESRGSRVAGVGGERGPRVPVEWGSTGPSAAVNWHFGNFCRIVFTLNFVMWVKVKPEFSGVCAARFTQLQSSLSSLSYRFSSRVYQMFQGCRRLFSYECYIGIMCHKIRITHSVTQ